MQLRYHPGPICCWHGLRKALSLYLLMGLVPSDSPAVTSVGRATALCVPHVHSWKICLEAPSSSSIRVVLKLKMLLLSSTCQTCSQQLCARVLSAGALREYILMEFLLFTLLLADSDTQLCLFTAVHHAWGTFK